MQSTEDKVNHPKHYTDGNIECLDAIESALTPEEYRGYLKGVIMKYIWRSELKGEPIQDILKAEFYLKRLIELRRNSEESDLVKPIKKVESQVEKVWSFS